MSTGEKDPPDDVGVESLLRIVAHLRSPQGCPWDREQTHASLRRSLIEECYEAIEAIDEADPHKLAEELGDILVHVAFHAQIAKEAGEFTLEEVVRGATEKFIRRHPHVFGDAKVADARDVEAQWQAIKGQERAGTGASLLDGAPRGMPALAYSQSIQDRASRSGFDWDDLKGVLAKVTEELQELEAASTLEEKEGELGDVLFSLVNTARWLGLDAEGALRQANARFYDRFTYMEHLCRERGLSFSDLPIQQKEALWQEAKAREAEKADAS